MTAAHPAGGALIRGARPRSQTGPLSRLHAAVALDARSSRRADIQGLRAVAVILVVAFHAGLPVPGGFTGVDVFFAISGFVITTMLVSELEGSGQIDLPSFYARRVKRLLPALALMLTAVALLGALLSPAASQHTSALTGITASFFAANAYVFNLGAGYFDVDTSLNPLLHTWTLAVEEQFYLIFPLVLLISWRLADWFARRARKSMATVAVGTVTVGSFLLSIECSGDGRTAGFSSTERFAFFASPTRAWEFGAGAILALAVPWLVSRVSAGGALIIGVCGAVAVGAGAASIDETMALPGTAALLPVCGACALLLAGARSGVGAAHVLSLRPMVWLGDTSYSWYLWHWPLIVFSTALWPGSHAAAPAAAVLSLLPSWLSYRFVENRFRFGRSIRGRRVVALGAVCLVVPVSASVGLLAVRNALETTSTMRSWERSQLLHVDVVRGCDDSSTPRPALVASRCTWDVPESRGDVALVGDSNAGHFAEPVIRAANEAGFTATVVTYSSCPFIDLRVVEIVGPGERLCRQSFDGTLHALFRLRPALVIIAARTDKYVEGSQIGLRMGSGPVSYAPVEKADLWRKGLRSTLALLNEAGIRVLLVHPIPSFPHASQDCTILRILRNGCASTRLSDDVERELSRSVRAEDAAVATAPATRAIDFGPRICDERMCTTARRGVILYRDGDHLSVDGALTLTDHFYNAIVANARASPKRASRLHESPLTEG